MRILSFCSVVSCKNCCSVNNPGANGITFHKFPTDPYLRDQWIKATGRKDWTPVNTSTICSEHFDEDYFALGSERKLSDDAIPTINVAAIPVLAVSNMQTQNPNEVILIDDDNAINIKFGDSDEEILKPNEVIDDEKEVEKLSLYPKSVLIRKMQSLRIELRKKRDTLKALRTKLRRHDKKVELQNKIISDLMEMYGLRPNDLTILKNAIIKAQNATPES